MNVKRNIARNETWRMSLDSGRLQASQKENSIGSAALQVGSCITEETASFARSIKATDSCYKCMRENGNLDLLPCKPNLANKWQFDY